MNRIKISLLLLGAVVLVAMPLGLSPNWTNVLTHALIMALFALAYGLVAGQGGMLSFGHAAFFGIGAFAAIHTMSAVEADSFYIPLPLVPVVGALAGFLLGWVAGYFATLRSGIYFAMITLAIAEFINALAPNFEGVFGGEGGLSGLRYKFLSVNFYTENENYYLILFWFVLGALALYYYTKTPIGQLTVALRENEKRVSFLGFNARRLRNFVFAVSAMFSAVAGSLMAITMEYVNYTILGIDTSANIVLATFIGGSTVFAGPAVGAVLLTVLQSFVSDFSRFWLLYQGLLFVAIMMYAPRGLYPVVAEKVEAIAGGRRGEVIKALIQLASYAVLVFIVMFSVEALASLFEEGSDPGPMAWLAVGVLVLAFAFPLVRPLLAGRKRSVPSAKTSAKASKVLP